MIHLADVLALSERHGAPVAGACAVASLPRNREEIERILPGASHVVVVAAPHGRAAIASANVQVAQFDTRHTYDAVSGAAHALVRWLEGAGHRAVAAPGFLPIDMAPPKNGMRGAVDWREAGVRAGLGGRGDCGLLVTPAHGTAVRLAGVLVAAEVETTPPLAENPCTHCGRCVEACPAGALGGDGRVDKKRCGDPIFAGGGFRVWRGFLARVAVASAEEREGLLSSQQSLDLWQNFMTGIYYSCWACQAACPVGVPGTVRSPAP